LEKLLIIDQLGAVLALLARGSDPVLKLALRHQLCGAHPVSSRSPLGLIYWFGFFLGNSF
jgi:hypothetical protein